MHADFFGIDLHEVSGTRDRPVFRLANGPRTFSELDVLLPPAHNLSSSTANFLATGTMVCFLAFLPLRPVCLRPQQRGSPCSPKVSECSARPAPAAFVTSAADRESLSKPYSTPSEHRNAASRQILLASMRSFFFLAAVMARSIGGYATFTCGCMGKQMIVDPSNQNGRLPGLVPRRR